MSCQDVGVKWFQISLSCRTKSPAHTWICTHRFYMSWLSLQPSARSIIDHSQVVWVWLAMPPRWDWRLYCSKKLRGAQLSLVKRYGLNVLLHSTRRFCWNNIRDEPRMIGSWLHLHWPFVTGLNICLDAR